MPSFDENNNIWKWLDASPTADELSDVIEMGATPGTPPKKDETISLSYMRVRPLPGDYYTVPMETGNISIDPVEAELVTVNGRVVGAVPAQDDITARLTQLIATNPQLAEKIKNLGALSGETPERVLIAAVNLYQVAVMASRDKKKVAVVEPGSPALADIVNVDYVGG